jgi:hypothetical protein
MGSRGPVPKASADRRRRNTPAAGKITTAPAASTTVVVAPPAPDHWHPVAARLYAALADSGQSRWYEPSDWAMAYLVAESMSRDLNPQFVGFAQTGIGQTEPEFQTIPLKGASLASYLKAMSSLLATEGDRRRVSIELRRTVAVDDDEVAAVASLDAYRASIGA